MVRRKIEIKTLEDKGKRHTTFTKRRNGLMKKAKDYCRVSSSSAAVITFSNAGNCYVLAHPNVDTVLERYEDQTAPALAEEAGTSAAGGRVHGGDEEEEAPLTEVQTRIGEAIKNGRWEEAVGGLGFQELNELYAEVENIRCKVVARERKDAAAMVEKSSGSGSSGSGSGCC
ncbi:hypothetical protein C2S52_020781 [Perilla frutescens var. hirtella]|nr:hypothetical protein C2S52_020781 [Perilla frutescens var. hirtella]KAH6805105.1 hypothetical protein C2S51_029936 [Perilla frutescens var. frutescens]